MSRSVRHRVALSVGLALAAGSLLSQAPAEPAPEPSDEVGWHVVRPGETLEKITERYLGAKVLWRENARLNPQLRDPDLLMPGQRLRVVLRRQLPERTALVREIANRVEDKPHPNPWQPAQRGDLLSELDGVRTYKNSSTSLLFDDSTELTVGENSLVFLREVRASLLGAKRETIEIVEGQAEIEAPVHAAGGTEVKIVVAGATATPQPGRSGSAQVRARLEDTGGSRVMVFNGESEVVAAGASIRVPTGMGTSVPEGGPPGPPERLLSAPLALAPSADSTWVYSNPPFRWRPVDRAASYTLEVCADSACSQLIYRQTGLPMTELLPGALPVGSMYWRVLGVSASALDGYASRAIPFTIDDPRPDSAVPSVAALVDGTASRSEEGLLLGPGAALTLDAHDDASGVAEISYRWDGAAWSTWSGRPLTPPSEVDWHLLEIQASDRAGRISDIYPIRVRIDADPPPPPTVELQ